MTHGSLFSGIGGFDLAAQWMGWENIFHCEWNPYGIPTELDFITFPKWRQESTKAAGNAIVPQVAFELFKIINIYNQ